MARQYWLAIIGPADRDELPGSADFPMRVAVRDAFFAIIGRPAADCWSGWGLTDVQRRRVMEAWLAEPGTLSPVRMSRAMGNAGDCPRCGNRGMDRPRGCPKCGRKPPS